MAMARPAAPPASLDAVAAAAVGRSGWPVVVLVWAAFALWQTATEFSGALSAMSTDDAMRLAQIRDLMAGQPWFDLTQYRLGSPAGVLMHWSRLVDLPVAAMLGLFERLTDADTALRLTLALWPAALLLAAMLACASAAASVAGPGAGALSAILLAASPAVTGHFGVGAIDHHGAQIALTLAMIACALRLDRSAAAAVGAGFSAAAMTAIGMETAPLVAACGAAVALRWAAAGAPMARGARLFGLSFAGGVPALAAATLPPDAWLAPTCDALGAGHIAVAIVGGVGLAASASFTTGGRLARISSLAQVAFAALAALAIAAPGCLASPYAALPERLKADWLAHVREAHGVLSFAADRPAAALAIGFALAVVALAGVWTAAAARGEARGRAWTVAALLAVACAMTLWQVRCASLAFAVGAVLLPAAALSLARNGGPLRLGLATAGLSPALLALAGLGVAQAAGLRSAGSEPIGRLCPVADYRALAAAAPPGVALNAIDSGPFLLAHTPMAAIAGPYHRNVDGISAALDAFGGTPEAARAVAISRGADLVVICPTDGGVLRAAKADPEGFSAALLAGRAPGWLSPVDLGPHARLRAWRVAP